VRRNVTEITEVTEKNKKESVFLCEFCVLGA